MTAQPRDPYADNKTTRHKLVVEVMDCEFYAECSCGDAVFGMLRIDRSLDRYLGKWERHMMEARR